MENKKVVAAAKKEPFGRHGVSLKVGLLGLQNSGKTTTFDLLTTLQPETEKSKDTSKIKAEVSDSRIEKLCSFYKKISAPPLLNIIDLSANIKYQDNGLGAEMISSINQTDAILEIVKLFEEEGEEIDPIADLTSIKEEFINKDKQVIEKVIADSDKKMKKADSKTVAEIKEENAVLQKVLTIFENKQHIRSAEWTSKEMDVLNKYLFLTTKPIVYLLNLPEKDLLSKKNKWLAKVNSWINSNGGGKLIPYSVAYEQRLNEANEEEREKIIVETGADTSLKKIVNAAYSSLDLVHFFTVGETMVKVWTIKKGFSAPQAAGILHSDFEKKFISAEIVNYEDLIAAGSEEEARQSGKMRVEGKTCEVIDGDIVYFKFNASDPVKKK
jgi:obg-like ATPase 1